MPVRPRPLRGRMDKLNKITVPAGQKLRQLQKIVYDIKKNDTGIMSKFKKLTSKPPPTIPPVDYVPDHTEEEEQWSDDFDSDYENPDHPSDSEMYVVPTEDNCDDSYEPPPSEHDQKNIPAALPCSGGVYADDRRSTQQKSWPLPVLPNQPLSISKKPATLPLLPSAVQKPKHLSEPANDEADYVVPVDDAEDNYIEPTEESTLQPGKPPVVNRATKPPCSAASHPSPASSSALDVYEVPEEEQESSPPLHRMSKPLPPKPVVRPVGGHSQERNTAKESFTPDMFKLDRKILPLPRHRLSPKVELDGRGTQTDGNNSASVSVPSPFPRITKKVINPVVPLKPSLPDRDHLNITEDKPIPAERRRSSSHDIPLPPIPPSIQKPLPQKPPILPRSLESVNRTLGSPSHSFPGGSTTAEQDADVVGKPWYTASSDRKTAEDALYKSNKDGSFLVRKSSGQDSKQPYTLVVFYNKRVYNIPIRFIESQRQYALGREKKGEERFDSVAEIIENHQRTSLVLIDSQNNTKDSTKLKYVTRVS